jgi:hypothetical protein
MTEPDAQSILEAALKLPEPQQLDLVSRLLENLPPVDGVLSVDDPSLEEELDRRFADTEGSIPWSELKAE